MEIKDALMEITDKNYQGEIVHVTGVYPHLLRRTKISMQALIWTGEFLAFPG